ncbi:hypothetical protein FQN57_005745 [Myotisia sp. PD_48]|nr:hypothetical protein FQN57_005745 [Myotisia sp. PD_48]
MSTPKEDPVSQPFLRTTAENHSAWVVVSTWLFMIITVTTVLTTSTARIRVIRTLVSSDWFLLLATTFAVAEGICISLAGFRGLGQRRALLKDVTLEDFTIFIYASQILAIASLACSKASITLLIISIKPLKNVLRACYILLAVVSAWAISGIAIFSLQCGLPRPWDVTNNCGIVQYPVYLVFATGNILTDLALVILPFIFLLQVQLSRMKRLAIGSLFGIRITVPVCSTLAIITSHSYYHSELIDKPWFSVTPIVWTQAMLCLSIVSTCIPSLKRVLAALQTGLMSGMITECYELSVSGGNLTGSSNRAGKGPYPGSRPPNLKIRGSEGPSLLRLAGGDSTQTLTSTLSPSFNQTLFERGSPRSPPWGTEQQEKAMTDQENGAVRNSKRHSFRNPIAAVRGLVWERRDEPERSLWSNSQTSTVVTQRSSSLETLTRF